MVPLYQAAATWQTPTWEEAKSFVPIPGASSHQFIPLIWVTDLALNAHSVTSSIYAQSRISLFKDLTQFSNAFQMQQSNLPKINFTNIFQQQGSNSWDLGTHISPWKNNVISFIWQGFTLS